MKRLLGIFGVALIAGACGEAESTEEGYPGPVVSQDLTRLSLEGSDYFGRLMVNVTALGSATDPVVTIQALEPVGGFSADGVASVSIDDMLQLTLKQDQLAVTRTGSGVAFAPVLDPGAAWSTAHSVTRRDSSGVRSRLEHFSLVGGSLEIEAGTGVVSGGFSVVRTGDFDYAADAWLHVDDGVTYEITFSGDDTAVYCFEGEDTLTLGPGATLPCTAVKATLEQFCKEIAASNDAAQASGDPSPGMLVPGCE